MHVRLQKVLDMQDKKLRDGFAQDILLPFLLCKTNRTVIVRVGLGAPRDYNGLDDIIDVI